MKNFNFLFSKLNRSLVIYASKTSRQYLVKLLGRGAPLQNESSRCWAGASIGLHRQVWERNGTP